MLLRWIEICKDIWALNANPSRFDFAKISDGNPAPSFGGLRPFLLTFAAVECGTDIADFHTLREKIVRQVGSNLPFRKPFLLWAAFIEARDRTQKAK